MKLLLLITLLISVAFGQAPPILGPAATAPAVPISLPPNVVKALQDALNAAAKSTVPVPLVPSSTFVEPAQVLGLGVGVQGLGPAQIQGGDFVGQHIATNTYTIEATDLVRMPGGGVGTSAGAGVLNILHRFGPVYVGVVGTAGAAEGATGSASGALSGWGVIGSTFGKKPLGIAFAAQTTKVAGAPGPTGQFKLYLTYNWFK